MRNTIDKAFRLGVKATPVETFNLLITDAYGDVIAIIRGTKYTELRAKLIKALHQDAQMEVDAVDDFTLAYSRSIDLNVTYGDGNNATVTIANIISY